MLFSKSFHSHKLTLTLLVMGLLVLVAWGGVATPPTAVASPANLPSTITVNTAVLSPTTAGNPADGKCDLREALQASFTAATNGQAATFNECTAGAGPVFIVFDGGAAGQTITMPAGGTILPFIKGNVTLTGPITLAGSGVFDPPGDNHDSRLLRVAGSGTLNLVGLTITNGFTSGGGGAILGDNGSTINTAGVSFVGNAAYGDGGAINSNGSVNILATNFAANQALGKHAGTGQNNPNTGYGGAIYISGAGSLNIALSNLSANTTDKSGGAIYVGQNTTATITDSSFAANVAGGNGDNFAGGGALYNKAGGVSITRSTFNANLSLKGYGGALFNQLGAGSFTIEDSSFNANVVQKNSDNAGFGGAIYTEEDMSITRSTFNANVVQADNGRGGAIANNRAAILRITNSTFLANVVTVFGGVTPSGAGGAIANYDNPFPVSSESTVSLRNVTFYLNKSNDDAALYNANGEVIKLWNTILDHGVNASPLCSGTAPDNMGHNIQSDGTSCGAGILTADPKLNTPDFNGGALPSLLSMMPKADSPAVDAGDPAQCSGPLVNNEDQRASSRPKDGNGDGSSVCDIGAIEADTAKAGFAATPVSPGPLDFGLATPSTPQTFIISVQETGNLTLNVAGAISGPNAADFGIISTNPFSIADGDSPVQLQLNCDPVEATAGPRTATLTLTTNDSSKLLVTYDLVCAVPVAPTAAYASNPTAPGPIDLGEVPTDLTVSQKTFHITNVGTADLTVDAGTLTGPNAADFNIVAVVPAPIAPNMSTPRAVACAPNSAGLKLATLTYTTNDPLRPTVAYNLVCEGIAVPPPFLHVPGTAVANNSPAASNGDASSIVTSPDGNYVYMTDYLDSLLTVYKVTPTGNLERVTTYQNGVGGVAGMDGPFSLTVSPDGLNVYVAAFDQNAVVVFGRDTQTGLLTYRHYVQEGFGYNCVFMGPCANTIDGLQGAYDVEVSADGKNVYVTGRTDGAVVVFSRSASGALTDLFVGAQIVEIVKDPILAGARGLALSPDDQHLYVTSSTADALVVFARNSADGKLTFRQSLQDGGLNQGLNEASKVLVSADGRHVYVAAFANDSLAVFQRNSFSGQLIPVEVYFDGVGGFDGLNYPGGMAMSADGRYLYVPSYLDDVLNVFARSVSSGKLYPVQMATQPELDGAFEVAVGADAQTVYVAPYNTSAAVVFQPSNPAPAIETLLPASAPAGAPNFTLSIKGSNFQENSEVAWNGVVRPATFVSDSELKIQVTTADLPVNMAVTEASVSVANPAPGGGAAVRNFVIIQSPTANPVPAIESLSPQSLPAGDPAFTMDVEGTGFMPSSQVLWNGQALATTYVNSGRLQAAVPATLLTQIGTAVVSVQNAAPGGGASNNAPFDVVAPGQNPAPTLVSLSPGYTQARGPASKAVQVTITGQNFLEGAQAQWNGLDRPTAWISETEVVISLTAADVADNGSGSIRVVNPEPGGGPSNTLGFGLYGYTIFMPMAIQ